ncbi:MAG: tryptophan synthase subunit alpha, partial [Candidatus Eremiobacteraeota bacterium]|nr:tryptophan synthase subunit alpha [Candidatus Eremiobacteraeota bacterium]
QIAELRSLTQKPIAVGFGISTADHVRAIRDKADGVIVGSALLDAYAGTRGEEAAKRAATFLCGLEL